MSASNKPKQASSGQELPKASLKLGNSAKTATALSCLSQVHHLYSQFYLTTPFNASLQATSTIVEAITFVAVDRYSNWPIIKRGLHGAKGLTNILRCLFATYVIPDELSSDGGPEFTSLETVKFFNNWGVHHPLLSHTQTVEQRLV